MTFQSDADADTTAAMFADAAAAFARLDDQRVRRAMASPDGFDRGTWAEMAQQGWLAITVPEEQGGLGLGMSAATIIARRLGYTVFPEPFVAAGLMAAACLTTADILADHRERLEALMDGSLIVTIAWQGEAGGMELEACGVRSVPAEEGFLLSGHSRFVSMPSADAFIVAAMGDQGLGLFWVGGNAPGLSIEREALADGSSSGRLTLDSVRIERDGHLISAERGASVLQHALATALIASSAELVGVMDRALEMTLDYLRTRRQFGVAIGSFQALQHRTVDIWIQRQLAEAAVDAAAAVFDSPDTTTDERWAAASSAKARAGQAALLLCSQAVQLHGAIGFAEEYGLGLYLNRALTLSAWLGNAAWHRRDWLKKGDAVGVREEAITPLDCHAPPDGDWDTISDNDFRMIVRKDFEQNYPAHLRYPSHRLRWSELRPWYLRMAEKGWLAPNWPRSHGGMGLSASKSLAFLEEQERWGIARFQDHGILMVGPVLMRFGSDEQRRRYLPPILACEEIWCQGYSETDAGSDLAGLRTTAHRDGDDFIINGQKIWTTLAQDATHIFVLVRTDPAAKKQAGISFLLVDITNPGITIRPIRDIAGHEELNEVFFDNVRTPATNLVGELNGGWIIAKSLLGFERISLGSPKFPEYGLQVLVSVAQAVGVERDPVFLDKFAMLQLDVVHLAHVYQRFAALAGKGMPIGPDVSMLKIFATELFQRIADLIIETAGSSGGLKGHVMLGGNNIDILGAFYKARPATIYGGSNEIQRNIIARNVLDLPHH